MTSSNLLPSYQLAAIASAAMEGLSVVAVSAPQQEGDRQTAVLKSSTGRRVLATTATTPEESTSLIIESRLLQLVAPHMGADVSVSKVVGRFSQGTLSTVFFDEVKGRPLAADELERDAELRRRVGRAIARIHLVPAHELEDAGLPFYEASEVRSRKLNLLDAAAGTGKVPSVLLSRWEDVLEEAGLWRFTPTAVHGDLNDDRFLVDGETLVVTDWAALTVADPGEDFAWIMSLPAEARKDVFEAYFAELAEHDHPKDTGLERRALFNAEFAVAEYLMTAVRQKDEERISTAASLLLSLAKRLDPEATAPGKSRPSTDADPAQTESAAPSDDEASPEGRSSEEDAASAAPAEADTPERDKASARDLASEKGKGPEHASDGERAGRAPEAQERVRAGVDPAAPVGVGISREERAKQREAAHGSHAAGLADGPATTAQPTVSPDGAAKTDRYPSASGSGSASGKQASTARPQDPSAQRSSDNAPAAAPGSEGRKVSRTNSGETPVADETGTETEKQAVQARDPEGGNPDRA